MNLDQLRKRKSMANTGFDNSGRGGGRILNKDGSANVIKTGIPFYKRYSIFHYLLGMSWPKFFLIVFILFVLVNTFFAAIYFFAGAATLGIDAGLTPTETFSEAFFFSVQTLTTVGYGRINPLGVTSGIVSSIEAFTGLLSFSILTGLLYGRFSKPRAYLIFSKNALIAPFGQGKALMFRLASYKYNSLTELEAQMVVSMLVDIEGKQAVRYYNVKLDIAKVTTLALNWTLVHPIDEESPLNGFEKADYEKSKVEVLVFIKAFDEHFSNIVKETNSYLYNEMVFNARFDPMFRTSDDGMHTLLELDKIDDYTQVR